MRLLPRSTVFGYHDHNFLTIAGALTDHLKPASEGSARERIWRVRAKEVVLGHRRHRATSSLREQRSPRRDAGVGGVGVQ
jgi:hypothetical protein